MRVEQAQLSCQANIARLEQLRAIYDDEFMA
jgi:hypothetical protein